MKLRFLQTTPSLSPDCPFQAGQIIDIASLSSEMRAWLKAAPGTLPRAELVKEPELEAAVVAPVERAAQPRAKGRAA